MQSKRWSLSWKDFPSLFRAETRTPGLSRKSNSTLSLVNDVEMEVTDQLKTMPSNLSLVNDVEMEVGEWKNYENLDKLFMALFRRGWKSSRRCCRNKRGTYNIHVKCTLYIVYRGNVSFCMSLHSSGKLCSLFICFEQNPVRTWRDDIIICEMFWNGTQFSGWSKSKVTGLLSWRRTTASMQKRLNKSQLKKPHNSYTYLIDNIIDNKEVGQISTKPQNAKALKDFDIL